jgi:hypothetical protein
LAFKIHNAFFHPWLGSLQAFKILTEHGRRSANACFKWSDCTRTKRAGQFHKNGAMVEFSVPNWV